ncbi:MAG: polysaccharide biosynthesis C-terminal domain-containing protein [Methanoregula sp.]|uniref:oligosaccharide flippase family protein n=1 Tax=Methanoregula sp. TaxID=2052170 RepID=UPI003C318B1A
MSEKELEVQRHGTMYLISSIGITLVGFLATMFYAHWIGPGVLGQYFLFLSCFAIASLFTDLGIGYAATYRICEGKDPDEFFSASIVLRVSLWLIVAVVMLVFHNYFGTLDQTGLLWILIAVLGISTLVSSCGTAIGASNRLGLAASVSLIQNITQIVIQVIAVFLGFKVYGLIGGLFAGLLTEIVIEIKYIDYQLKKFHWSHVKSIFSFSSWAFLSTFCTTLFDNTNPLIIAYFMPISDVGVFGVCWTFTVFALFVSTALCNTLFVKVSRWRSAGDWDAITIALSRATSYSLILAIPMLIGGAILGGHLLYYVYGASFAIGATALVIIIGARVVQSVLLLYSNFLMATDHVKHQFFGLFTGVIVNILLACILIPVWGLPGAAVASLSNAMVSAIICRHYLRKVILIQIEMKTIRDILISTGIMAIIILPVDLFLNQSLLATAAMVGLGAIIYLAVLFIINSQIREDVLKTVKIRWIS